MLEVCVDSFESCQAAVVGGAYRIELCSALGEGGLTPSVGLLKAAKQNFPNVKIFCMLRPYGGSDFLFNDIDTEIILNDMKLLYENGSDGFVFGALTANGRIDEKLCTIIKEHAHNLPLTFHRAFDRTNPNEMIENAIKITNLGFHRLLTSGLNKTAELGLENIIKLCESTDNLIIMPGAGVTTANAAKILNETKCQEFHASAKRHIISTSSDMAFIPKVHFGDSSITDCKIVNELVQIGQKYLVGTATIA